MKPTWETNFCWQWGRYMWDEELPFALWMFKLHAHVDEIHGWLWYPEYHQLKWNSGFLVGSWLLQYTFGLINYLHKIFIWSKCFICMSFSYSRWWCNWRTTCRGRHHYFKFWLCWKTSFWLHEFRWFLETIHHIIFTNWHFGKWKWFGSTRRADIRAWERWFRKQGRWILKEAKFPTEVFQNNETEKMETWGGEETY